MVTKAFLSSLLFSSLFVSQIGKAQGSPPDIKKWVTEYQGSKNENFINRLMIIDGWKGKIRPVLAKYNTQELALEGLISTVSGAEIPFTYALNRARRKDMAKLNPTDKLRVTGLLNRSRDIIMAQKGGWQYFQERNGKLELVFAGNAPKQLSGSGIREWISDNLGYQGVVLDQKGEFFLVGNIDGNFANNNLQALVLAESHDKFRLPNKGDTGVGLLKLETIHQSYGIFRTIFLENEDAAIPKGSKLILETAK